MICTYAQLGMLGDDLSARYELGDNIDASASCGGDCGSPSGSGWTPVGDAGNNFSGTLDGNGYMISDLFVDISGDDGGFFGVIGTGAEVRNIGLSNVDVRAANDAGGLAGQNDGTISNSYVTGTVSASGSAAGGLVGYNNDGTISNSYAAAAVSTGSDAAGGLAGQNDGTISNSYAAGAASGGTGNAGGLVGYNNGGNISNSYATGAASGGAGSIGGLVGSNLGNISNSYAVGAVSLSGGGSEVGGLVGNAGGSGLSGITGINYFADTVDSDGTGNAMCGAMICVQDTLENIRDSLDEAGGLGWDSAVWGNLNMSGFPCLKNMPAGAPSC